MVELCFTQGVPATPSVFPTSPLHIAPPFGSDERRLAGRWAPMVSVMALDSAPSGSQKIQNQVSRSSLPVSLWPLRLIGLGAITFSPINAGLGVDGAKICHL